MIFGRMFGAFDRRRAVKEARKVLVGFTRHEAIKFLEPHARRPAVEGAGAAGFPDRGIVPLAEGRRAIAVLPQHLGDRRGRLWDDAVIAVEPRRIFGDISRVCTT